MTTILTITHAYATLHCLKLSELVFLLSCDNGADINQGAGHGETGVSNSRHWCSKKISGLIINAILLNTNT